MKKFDKIGVGIILVHDNHILLGKRLGKMHYGTWGIPGGTKEITETVEEAVVRETKEETGLNLLSFQRAQYDNTPFNTKEYLDSNYQYQTIFMEALKFEGEPVVCEPSKCEEWKWFKWTSLPEPLHLPVKTLYLTGFTPSLIAKTTEL